jgi:hypothetical protein
VYSPPVVSKPGTPLITRLARRQAGAIALSASNPVRARNRLDHVWREAQAAGITLKALDAEVNRLAVERAARLEATS